MVQPPDLRKFLTSKMQMSNYYQPLIVQVLLENNGRATAEQLAQQILLYNDEEMTRALRKLNVHPWQTLGNNHGVVRREGRGKTAVWILSATFERSEVPELVDICKKKIKAWCKSNASSSASLRYQLIQEAEGRCQACGVVSQVEDLHIDHITPQSKAQNGKVKTRAGLLIDVHSKENLQVLCATCNTGKREHGDFDFRPLPERLEHALKATLEVARKQGYDVQFTSDNVKVTYVNTHDTSVERPLSPTSGTLPPQSRRTR